MRSPAIIKKRDRMPDYYPVFEDLATPLGLASKLDPAARVVRLVGKTKSIKKIKDQRWEASVLDGYGTMEVNGYGGREAKFVLDCLDKKERHIEQEYRLGDITGDVLRTEIPEIIIKRIDYLRPAAKSCDICEVNGIESLLISHENQDPGPIEPINGRSITHSQYFLKLMAENRQIGIYPESDIQRYMKAVLNLVAMKGYDGKSLISSSTFLPEPYAQKAVESIISPWARDRWWTSIRKPAMRCFPAYQDTLTGNYRGRAVA
jgi:hypothetical protein